MQVDEFKATAKLIVSKEVQSQIMYLHHNVGNVEWSGLLFYSIVSGSVEEPGTLVLKTEKIYLMDIGSASYTEFNPDESIMDFYDKYPEAEANNWKWGMIHTHHNMACFFSGTDMDELTENSGSHNFYLSLIVNHASQFCAKIGVVVEIEEEVKRKYKFSRGLTFGGLFNKEPEVKLVKHLLVTNCDIIYEQNDFEVSRYEKIKADKTKVVVRHHSSHVNVGGFSGKQGSMFDEDYGNEMYLDSYEPYKWPDSYKKSKQSAVKHEANKVYLTKSKNEIKKYLACLFSLDSKNTKDLEAIIREVHVESTTNTTFDAVYWDSVHLSIKDIYFQMFDHTLYVSMYNKFFAQCLEVLKDYKNINCDITVDEMVRTLDEYIDREDEEIPEKAHTFGNVESEVDKQIREAKENIDKFIEDF